MGGDWHLGALVHLQLKNVGPRVVADHIQVKLPAHDLGTIDLSSEYGLAFRVGAGEEVPEGIHDAAAAPRHDSIRVVAECGVIVRGKIALAVELIAGKYEAAPLDGNMAHRSDPGISRIGSRRAI